MIKRIISVCLLICMLFAFMPAQVYAESELTYGYVKIVIYNEQPMKTEPYIALLKDGTVYMSVENIASIAGYELNEGDFISFSKNDGTSVAIGVDVDYDGTAHFQNKEKKLSFIENEQGFYLPFVEMLYLLHTQWAIEDDVIVVQQLTATIEDFLDEYREEILMNRVNQTDLLINGESRIAHVLRTSLAAMFNDFNIFDYISWDISVPNTTVEIQEKDNGDREISIETAPTAESEFIAKQYKEAILQLSVDDKGFLTEDDQKVISDAVAKSGYQQLTSNWKDLTLLSGLPGNIAGTIEDMQKLQGQKPYLLFDKFGDLSALKDIPTKNLNKFAEVVGPIIDVTDACIKVAEICNRSKQWDKDFISQVSVLTDFDNTGYNTKVTDYIKVTAREIVKEKQSSSASAWKQAVQGALDAGTATVMNATPLGLIFAAPNIGMAVAKTNEELKNSVDAAELAYMVACLIKVEQVAYNELSCSLSDLYGLAIHNYEEDTFDEDSLTRLRSASMLTLRCNLRNHAFIYYLNLRLNDDQQWEESVEAQNIREQIRRNYVLICELMETEKSDKQLLRRDVEKPFNIEKTFIPEDMDKRGDVRQQFGIEIFHEGEIPESMATTVRLEHGFTDNGEEYAFITGIDNSEDTVWTYETGKYAATEWDRVTEIGVYNDAYYFVEDGTIIALQLSDASVLWKNEEFGGSGTAFTFGTDGTLYICGYYGPDFFAVDTNGKTLCKIEQFSEEYWWPYKIECTGDIVSVTLEGGYSEGNVMYIVDLLDFSYAQIGEYAKNYVSEEWKSAYIEFIMEQGPTYSSGKEIEEYKLIRIDDNNIPELYINLGGLSDVLCSYCNDSFINLWVYDYGLSYQEGQNLFMDTGGHMDLYWDKVYRIENGEFVLVHEGKYGSPDNSNVQIDDEGHPIYEYYWNDIKVSSEIEYKSLLSSVYDEQSASTPYDGAEYDNDKGRYVGNGICNYLEILMAIINY